MVQKDNANKVQENNAVISSLFNKLVLMGVKNAFSMKFWMEGRINLLSKGLRSRGNIK